MSFSRLTMGALLAAALATSACEATGDVQGPRLPPGAAPPIDDPPPPPRAGGAQGGGDALFRRLGADGGIRTVMTDFVGRVAKDPRINGYFLNAGVSPVRVIECLVIQVGALTGGPFTYPSAGCRDMKAVHRGMNISMADFQDTAGHLVAALTAARVAQADINAIVAAVLTTVPDIVEDPGNNRSVYHRVGRKPAIDTVVAAFMRDVFNDPRINGFFAGVNADRLRTCLTRQVCGIDGPCQYGKEVDGAEPGVSSQNFCKDMRTSHQGINNPRAITKADFDTLVGVLVGVLDRAGVPATDKQAVLAALGPACREIVANGTGCN
jgi:truncated hemoglobin YjbI